jgi:hypothetical protein
MGLPTFPIGPITGPNNETLRHLDPPQTNVVRISSFDPAWHFRPGGAGGVVQDAAAQSSASANHETFKTTQSYDGFLQTLEGLKRDNGGQALDRIVLETHGGPDLVQFGDGTTVSANQIVTELSRRGLVAPGGKVEFSGCEVAGSPEARSALAGAARANGVKIEANETLSIPGIPGTQWAFYPDGKQERFFGF